MSNTSGGIGKKKDSENDRKEIENLLQRLKNEYEKHEKEIASINERRERELHSISKEHDDTVIELNKQITKLKNDLEDEKKFSSNINQVYMKDYWENYKGKKRRKTKRRHKKK